MKEKKANWILRMILKTEIIKGDFIMSNKYTDKEIIAAINIVSSILEVEDFALDVGEYSIDGSGWTTALKFDVDDMQNNGRLEDKIFDNLDDVIRETNVYSSLLDSFHNRVGAETIPQDDWDRKALIFLTSDYCKELDRKSVV